MIPDLFQMLILAALAAIVVYLVWQHQKRPGVSIPDLLREGAGDLRDRVSDMVDFKPTLAAPPAAPPFGMTSIFVDRDDLMYALGRAGITQAVRLDGRPVHSGNGPGLDFYTQPGNAGISAARPAVTGAQP